VIVGHPFDTIKVRLQTATTTTTKSNASSFFSSSGGFRSLYRGLSAPLSMACFVNAIVFSSYGTSSRVYDHYFTPPANNKQSQSQRDPWQKSFLCGSFAGAVQCLVICPTEHLKCRLQIQGNSSNNPKKPKYNGPLHLAKQIISRHGFFDGLFRGWNVTCVREIPAFGAYFCVYDVTKDTIQEALRQRQQEQMAEHSRLLLSSIVAGGLSGCITWLMVYPVDVIKSRIQTNPLDSNHPSHRNMIPVANDIVSRGGYRALFRGVGVTMLRAFPVNGTVFPVYEFTLLWISNLKT